MFVSFMDNGLVTCSTDHLLILWKNGENQSRLRSEALFKKLEENGGLWPETHEPPRWELVISAVMIVVAFTVC